MIDWQATAEKYGYSNLPNCFRPAVICMCDKCRKRQSIIIRVKSKLVDEQMSWVCRSCNSDSIALSDRSKKLWKDEKYKERHKRAMSSAEVRNKMVTADKALWENQDHKRKASITSRVLWENSEYREKITAASKALWESQEYREKMTAIMSSQDMIDKLSTITKMLWKNPEYKKKTISALTSPATLNKMAVANKAAWENPEYRKKMATATQLGRVSSIQEMLYTYLNELGIEYYKEGEQTQIGYYVFDCLIVNGNKKLLVECQGDYWHSLPESERRDRGKFIYISRYFPEYEIMYVWEHEFYCKDRVLDRLKLKLDIGIETKEFKFSDLTIREINSTETKTFLDLYHYLGKDRGGRAIGAYFGDLLIAAAVFSPPLRQNTAQQFGLVDGEVRELSRLCIHPSYHKKNFASWFIKRATKQIDCKLIVAYADTTVGHIGTIYKASNFKLHHTVPADYWYVDKEGYVMHKRTLYGKAKSLKMTEKEFAEAKGYSKKFGGEKLCFVQ